MLGRGVDMPMPVILVALGGMAAAGIVGMFLLGRRCCCWRISCSRGGSWTIRK
jgi:hypothetical protein